VGGDDLEGAVTDGVDGVGVVGVEAQGVFVEELLPVWPVVDELVVALLGDVTIHLIKSIELRATGAGVGHGDIHHLQDDFALRVLGEDAVDDLGEVITGVLDAGVAFGNGIVDGEFDEHRIGFVLEDFFIEAFHAPVGVGTSLGTIDDGALSGVLLIENGGDLVDPGADGSEASTKGDQGLLFAGVEITDQLCACLLGRNLKRSEHHDGCNAEK